MIGRVSRVSRSLVPGACLRRLDFLISWMMSDIRLGEEARTLLDRIGGWGGGMERSREEVRGITDLESLPGILVTVETGSLR